MADIILWVLVFVCCRAQAQTYVDYSYPDDFAMDVTGPDTMINYSELPQQPNYYQGPQTAADTLNLGFNMSLQQQLQPAQPAFPFTSIPPAHQNIQSQGVSSGWPEHLLVFSSA